MSAFLCSGKEALSFSLKAEASQCTDIRRALANPDDCARRKFEFRKTLHLGVCGAECRLHLSGDVFPAESKVLPAIRSRRTCSEGLHAYGKAKVLLAACLNVHSQDTAEALQKKAWGDRVLVGGESVPSVDEAST